ncbi:MAG: universal stress protein, partial [Planctomycetota bacterium]
MRLLLYVDPSPRREAALALAGPLARRPGATLSLLATEEDLRSCPGLLDEAAAALPADPAPSRISRPGPAERAIVAETRTRPYDLLVVPPAGRGAIQRLLKASRVASVVRRVGVSVLVARGPASPPARVLAAIGGEGMAEAIARAAAVVSRAYAAEVTLLHVRDDVELPGPGTAPRPISEEGLPRARASLDSLGIHST